MDLSGLWVLEWCPSQNQFHIQELEQALKANRNLFIASEPEFEGWIPIYIGTEKQVLATAENAEAFNEIARRPSTWIQ